MSRPVEQLRWRTWMSAGIVLRSLLAALILATGQLSAVVRGQPAFARDQSFCRPGQPPEFLAGFAALKAALGPIMGDPLECAHSNDDTGDVTQATSTGLAFWRRATNTPTFTDGYRHWALTPSGLTYWEGASPDPPAVQSTASVQPSPSRTSENAPGARLEPRHGAYFGVNLDWGTDTAMAFNERLGARAAVYARFVGFPFDDVDARRLDDAIAQAQGQGGLALLTLEPVVPLGSITREMASDLAERLRAYNERGVPVFVRFAHEMNGSWYPWGQQPGAYVRAFRLLAEAVHARAPRTAMMWAPNYGGGYPFRGGVYEAKEGTPEYLQLDTNGDGQFDERDDMYAPYYPGDDAVDWVAMTVYHWGDQWPWGKNIVPEPGKFAAQITGTYVAPGRDEGPVPNFYAAYAEARRKPMAIPETSALYNTTAGGDPELEIKRRWWRQVLGEDVARAFPRIKLIEWFEWRKPEAELGGAIVDWRLTADPEMARRFLEDLPPDRFIFAPVLDVGMPAEPDGPRMPGVRRALRCSSPVAAGSCFHPG